MIQEEIRQIVPALGWRVLVCDAGDTSVKEVPVIGWGVVKFINEPQD